MSSINLESVIHQWTGDVRDDVRSVMQKSGEDGAERVRDIILEKETDWGRKRVAGTVGGSARPHAGRYETGDMSKAVDSTPVTEEGDEFVVRWGWVDGMDYYMFIQEYGASEFETPIEGMESLNSSLQLISDRFAGDLSRIAGR